MWNETTFRIWPPKSNGVELLAGLYFWTRSYWQHRNCGSMLARVMLTACLQGTFCVREKVKNYMAFRSYVAVEKDLVEELMLPQDTENLRMYCLSNPTSHKSESTFLCFGMLCQKQS